MNLFNFPKFFKKFKNPNFLEFITLLFLLTILIIKVAIYPGLWIRSCDPDFTLVATSNGTLMAVDVESRDILWSTSIGGPIYAAHQSPDEEDGWDSYVDVGEDWNFYLYKRGSKTIVERINSIQDLHSKLENLQMGTFLERDASFVVDAEVGSLDVKHGFKMREELIDIQRHEHYYFATGAHDKVLWELTIADLTATSFYPWQTKKLDCLRQPRMIHRIFNETKGLPPSFIPFKNPTSEINGVMLFTSVCSGGFLLSILFCAFAPQKKAKKKGRKRRGKHDTDLLANEVTIGGLWISSNVIGQGSLESCIYQGKNGSFDVAVKRLPKASFEVDEQVVRRLMNNGGCPNVVRLHCYESDLNHSYIAMDRCLSSLENLLGLSPDNVDIVELNGVKIALSDILLWQSADRPNPHLINLMRDVALGIAYLHRRAIVHGNLKPTNILIDRCFCGKVSDMGFSKVLDDAYCVSDFGWRAPEIIKDGHHSFKSDMFSYGLLLHFALSQGKHPFGDLDDENLESNVINDKRDLSSIDCFIEAVDLISSLLHQDPDQRLSACEVLTHPLFWDAEKRLSFLCAVADQVRVEDSSSDLVISLEATCKRVIGGDWGKSLDQLLYDNLKQNNYNFKSVCDLIRAIRNKKCHYKEDEGKTDLPKLFVSEIQGFESYFRRKFPYLLCEAYRCARKFCKHKEVFHSYFST